MGRMVYFMARLRKIKKFIISLDLSRQLLHKLYAIKQYAQPLDLTFLDHQKFIADFDAEIGLHITDREFPFRLEKSFRAVKRWLSKQ